MDAITSQLEVLRLTSPERNTTCGKNQTSRHNYRCKRTSKANTMHTTTRPTTTLSTIKKQEMLAKGGVKNIIPPITLPGDAHLAFLHTTERLDYPTVVMEQ